MLNIANLESGYEKVKVLNGIDVGIKKGEIVSIIGRNGVGKSTFMKTIIGLIKPMKGTIHFKDSDVTKRRAHERARYGMGYVPQGHGVFPFLSVEENLKMGQLISGENLKPKNFEMVYTYFPRLNERKNQSAGTMSGGEQAMLSIGRVLTGSPDMILLDEPSEGVQPNIVSQIGDIILRINKELNLTILLVEQHLGLIQQVSQRCYVMDKGSIIASLSRDELLDNETTTKYLSV